jgi:hypothetical protein
MWRLCTDFFIQGKPADVLDLHQTKSPALGLVHRGLLTPRSAIALSDRSEATS